MEEFRVTYTIDGTNIRYISKVNVDMLAAGSKVEAAIKDKLEKQVGVYDGIQIQKIEKVSA
ncbi:MAG: hypothetical protein KGH72_05740 [Candidatus Micrarchaeota archaeon]|nr:hypothetical protein [Candidatus Micrarchaeota archaeon]